MKTQVPLEWFCLSEFFDPDNQIQVYPNPHENEITIILKEDYEAILMDYTGKVVKEQKLVPGKNGLVVEENSEGIYFLKLRNQSRTVTLKLVKN